MLHSHFRRAPHTLLLFDFHLGGIDGSCVFAKCKPRQPCLRTDTKQVQFFLVHISRKLSPRRVRITFSPKIPGSSCWGAILECFLIVIPWFPNHVDSRIFGNPKFTYFPSALRAISECLPMWMPDAFSHPINQRIHRSHR